MYYYGAGQTGFSNPSQYCCPNTTSYSYPVSNNSSNSNYAIILVLFILLVIIIGTRWCN